MSLFDSEEYQKEKNKFFFLDEYKDLDTTLFETDHETYAISRSNSGCPTYIWTKDNLTDDEYEYISRRLIDFIENSESRFTTKKEFYKYLLKVKSGLLVSKETFILGFLEVKNLIKPKECEGQFRQATMNDLDLLVRYFFDLTKEEGHPSGDYETIKEKTKKFINNGLVYVWVDNYGKIVSEAEYQLYGNRAKVAGVYTPVEERRKGYSSNTMYCLTKLLLEKGYEVFLYTDYTYPNSNECYKKIGYEDKGYLINYEIKRK